jgi:predicted PurR-regulated permease PerM
MPLSWLNNRFFNYAVGTLLVLLILYLLVQIHCLFCFLIFVISTIVIPIIFAVILYYVLRPLRNMLQGISFPKSAAIGLIFFLIFTLLALALFFVLPPLEKEFAQFAVTPVVKIQQAEQKAIEIMNCCSFYTYSEEELKQTLILYMHRAFTWFSENIVSTVSSLATIASYFVITPFMLFYLLRDDYRMKRNIVRITPERYLNESSKLMKDVDGILAGFISSQVTVAAIVGSLILIGYMAIGMPYAFLLALIAFVFNLIPFFGPFIATIPALFIAILHSPLMAFEVVSIVLMVHLLDLNLISPRIVGNRLKIHPVTIVFLLISSLSVFGFLGLFVAVPVYAALKTIILNLFEFWKNRSSQQVNY